MKIKGKVNLVAGIPLIGLIIFTVINTFFLMQVNQTVRKTTQQTLLPIISEDMAQMNSYSASIEKLLNADRDAYQANEALLLSITSKNNEEIIEHQKSIDENTNQVEERAGLASAVYDAELKTVYQTFTGQFTAWKATCQDVCKDTRALAEEYALRDQELRQSVAVFDKMRDLIDQMEVFYEEGPAKDENSAKQVAEQYALLLNADRDAYQAYLAQLQIMEAADMKALESLRADYQENTGQTLQRVTDGAKGLTGPALELKAAFDKEYQTWAAHGAKVIEITANNINRHLNRQINLKRTEQEFSAMRDTINSMTEMLEARITAQTETIQQKTNTASDETDRLLASLSNIIKVTIAIAAGILVVALIAAFQVAKGIVQPIQHLVGVVQNLARGDLEVQNGEQRDDEIGQLMQSVGQMAGNLKETAECASRFAGGDLTARPRILSDRDTLGKALVSMAETIDQIVNEIQTLTDAARNGQLSQRGDADRYGGGWAQLIQGINQLIESFVKPIEVTSSYLDRISIGESPDLIVEEYQGDFNRIKTSLNRLIESTDQIATLTKEIADGDLDQTVEKRSDNDRLMESISVMVDRLSDFARNVQTAANQIASGSEQISSSTQQMAQGASEQAASIEEISSSMEEMSSTIRQNADNAQQTAAIAEKAANEAQMGGESVAETVKAMNSIAEKINIIEEIARQTNMLALNAAIEAARAGEHGKGFAVVASEVRKLAERSQNAAQEISTLSTNSVEIAEQAGKLLDEIVPGIEKTAQLVQEINAASSEQASGIDQITQAIHQLDQVVQQNSSSTEQLASASQEFSAQADQLLNVTTFFKLSDQPDQLKSDSRFSRQTVAEDDAESEPGSFARKREIPVLATGRPDTGIDLNLDDDNDIDDKDFQRN